MPFRLLGVAMDPSQAGVIVGPAFSTYRACGHQVTLVCMAAAGWPVEDVRRQATALKIRDVVLFAYQPQELASQEPRAALADLIFALRPHVVVAHDGAEDFTDTAAYAFAEARRKQGGSGALPAKLYYRASGTTAASTTVVSLPGGAPEVFVRVYPPPWVTGILERDLFSGLSASTQQDERLAA